VVIEGSGDRRSVPVAEFVRGVFTTASDHNEVVVEVVFPRPAPRAALAEFAERRGDIATAAIAVDFDASREVQWRSRYVTVGKYVARSRAIAPRATRRGYAARRGRCGRAADPLT
jgi:CO/xanthine dehydrogenase FAD-binding subunit